MLVTALFALVYEPLKMCIVNFIHTIFLEIQFGNTSLFANLPN